MQYYVFMSVVLLSCCVLTIFYVSTDRSHIDGIFSYYSTLLPAKTHIFTITPYNQDWLFIPWPWILALALVRSLSAIARAVKEPLQSCSNLRLFNRNASWLKATEKLNTSLCWQCISNELIFVMVLILLEMNNNSKYLSFDMVKFKCKCWIWKLCL